jgi:hypothetical protein
MRISARSTLNRFTLLVPFLLMPLVGCCSSLPFGEAIRTAKTQAKASDVGLILLGKDKVYFPDTLIVKNKSEAPGNYVVVWIAFADSLVIDWKPDPENPKDLVKPTCLTELFPFVCYWSPPTNLPPKTVIKYKATLRCKGKIVSEIDPRIEIVF